VVVDLAFPATLLTVAARKIVVGRNWRNLPMTAPLAVFVIAGPLMHLEALAIRYIPRWAGGSGSRLP
jgi:uncharacterized protein involved in response to NO